MPSVWMVPVLLIGGIFYGAYLVDDGGHPVWGVIVIITSLAAIWGTIKLLIASRKPTVYPYDRANCPMLDPMHPDFYYFHYKVKQVPTEWGAAGMMPPVVIAADYYAACSACGCNEQVPAHDSPHPR